MARTRSEEAKQTEPCYVRFQMKDERKRKHGQLITVYHSSESGRQEKPPSWGRCQISDGTVESLWDLMEVHAEIQENGEPSGEGQPKWKLVDAAISSVDGGVFTEAEFRSMVEPTVTTRRRR